MSIIVQVLGRLILFHEYNSASIWLETFMSMIVRVFGWRLFREYGSQSIRSETLS